MRIVCANEVKYISIAMYMCIEGAYMRAATTKKILRKKERVRKSAKEKKEYV